MSESQHLEPDRASFNRFGDDMHSLILSYLSVDDQYRLLCVNSMFLGNMFTMTHNVYFEQQWLAPINLIADIRLIDSALSVIRTIQYPAVRKLFFNLDHNCLRSVALFYNECSHIETLKLDGGQRKTMAAAYIGEVLQFIKIKPTLKCLKFNLMFNFTSINMMNLFISCYRNVVCELGFTHGFHLMPTPIITSLHHFTKLTALNIAYYNNIHINNQTQINLSVLQLIGREVPQLKRLIIYRSVDTREDVLFNLIQIKQLFTQLDYYYVGSMVGGLWRDDAYQKTTMKDMTKFQTLRAPIIFGDGYTIVYYSRKHSFLYYNQRLPDHQIIVPQDVKSLAYQYFNCIYHHEDDTTNLMALLRDNPNIFHVRARSECFTIRLLDFIVAQANTNPLITRCYAARNIEPLILSRNVFTNVAALRDRLISS